MSVPPRSESAPRTKESGITSWCGLGGLYCDYDYAMCDVHRLLAERDALREALEEIAHGFSFGSVHLQEIARAALDGLK